MKHRFLHGNNESGAAAVTVALVLIVLLGVMGFTMDTGYLYLKKNQYQNAVEAAAMAAAADLCGDDPVETGRRIAGENGLSDASGTLVISPGYYDQNNGCSEDFSEYRDFEADPDPNTPENEAVMKSDGDCCQYNNAVMVRFETTEKLLAGPLHNSDGTAVIRAAAVAYLKRYDIIAGKGGLKLEPEFASGFPEFQDTTIHANGDIIFLGSETFAGDGSITATGSIIKCPGDCTGGASEVELEPLETVMEELRDQAEAEGTLIPASGWPIDDEWHNAPFGRYQRKSELKARIAFSAGDHNGAVYFLSIADTGGGVDSIITTITVEEDPDAPESERTAWNFTFASDTPTLNFRLLKILWGGSIELGGEGENTAYFYIDGQILYQPLYASGFAFNFKCLGVFFRCRKFQQRWYQRPAWEGEQKMRIIADEITYEGVANKKANPLFNSLFGPPCPPTFVKLGLLEPSN